MTRYAVGDIHGGAKTFRALLDRIDLQYGDKLYLLGDYIDRGPDSKGVLDIILQLMESGFNLRPVRGNHDDMMFHAVKGYNDDISFYWMNGWGIETLKSFGLKNPEELQAPYLSLLEQMPYLWSDDDFVFVHAGLDMTTDDPLTESSSFAMTWGETGAVDPARLGGRRLVTGHHPYPLPLIEIFLKSSHIFLDNGAFVSTWREYGNLVAMDLERMKITIQPWLDGRTS